MLFITCCLLFSLGLAPGFADVDVDPGEPLFLTPYILSGQIKKAQQLSFVPSLIPGKEIPSYSGFITVNETTDASMFFWYFPTTRDDAPLLIWLQGGPGSTSLFGLFVEIGPYMINEKDGSVMYRDVIPWNMYYNVLYVDNPVGTGYSFVTTSSDYRTDQNGVVEHLFIFLTQFVKMFPDISDNGLYIAGESYGGKYVPSFGYKVFKEMQAGASPIDLKGIIVGNGLSDPETMIPVIGEHLYSLALLDYPELMEYREGANACVSYIQQKKWTEAYKEFNKLIFHGVLIPYPSLYQNSSGCYVYYDFVKMCPSEPPNFSSFGPFVTRNDTRAAIHVGNMPFVIMSYTVKDYMVDDVPQSVRPLVEEMLNSSRVKVLYFSGMRDLIVPVPATDTFLRKIQWVGASDYLKANRTIWQRKLPNGDTHVNGYVKQAHNLTFALVRDASHIVPMDQPIPAFDMIFRFIENKPFSDLPTLPDLHN